MQNFATLESTRSLEDQLTPRQYQADLFREARSRNVVVYLDTGSGKTLISVLLIQDKAHELQRAQKKITVFLAPRVSLVHQQAEVMRKHLDLRVGLYYGELNLDCWNKAKWMDELAGHDLLVMTPQVLLDVLRHGFITLGQVNLLIFDEAHHCVKKAPYNCIMSEFYHDTRFKGPKPHIFGMTASPVNVRGMGNVQQLQATMLVLEKNLDAKVLTIPDRDELDRYAPIPKLHVDQFSSTIPEGLIARAADKLLAVYNALQVVDGEQQTAWDLNRIRMLGVMEQGMPLDKEKHSTLSATMARNIMGVVIIMLDLGPLAAAVAFAEVLRPAQVKMYKVRHQQQANGRLPTLNGTFEDTDDDWFQGVHDTPGQRPSRKLTGGQPQEDTSEGKRVHLMLAVGAKALADAIVPTSLHVAKIGMSRVKPELPAYRQQVAEDLQAIISQLPPAVLDEHVAGIGPFSRGLWKPPCTLATSRLLKLTSRLLRYKAVGLNSLGEGPPRSTGGARLGWCCIVFVQRKLTSIALNAILRMTPAMSFLASAAFMGYGGSTNATSLDAKAQGEILKRYRAGELNCLVSTSVAEEGLDVRQCQLVIRYDLPATLLAFIQSRGRARMRASDMVLMVNQDVPEDLIFLEKALLYEQQMKAEVQRKQQLLDQEVQESGHGFQDAPDDELYVPATGAKITFNSAKGRLYYFCDKLPSDQFTQLRPRFSTLADEFGAVTTVILPNNSPVRLAKGKLQQNKALATSSACLEALKLLYKAGALTQHLQPESVDAHQRAEAAEEADRLGDDSSDSSDEPDGALGPDDKAGTIRLLPKVPNVLLVPPELVSFGKGKQTDGKLQTMELYLYEFQMEASAGAQDMDLGQSIGFLTLQQMPALPDFDMLLPRGSNPTAEPKVQAAPARQGMRKPAAVQERAQARVSIRALGRKSLSLTRVGKLQSWHRAFCGRKILPDEPKEDAAEESAAGTASFMPPAEWTASSHGAFYILAPLHQNYKEAQAGKTSIDWETVSRAKHGHEPLLQNNYMQQEDLNERLRDAVLVTAYNKHVYFHQSVAWDQRITNSFTSSIKGAKAQSAFDKANQTSVKQTLTSAKQAPQTEQSLTYEEYFRKRWGKTGLSREQPLLIATSYFRKQEEVRLPPEVCLLHPLTQPAFRAAYLGPHLVWWLTSLLRASELRLAISHPALTPSMVPNAMLMMEACTSKACGQLISYETLETLGDAFLKFATSAHLYQNLPKAHEGQLTLHKNALVSNAHLARAGKRLGLHTFHAIALDENCWHPPGMMGTTSLKGQTAKLKVLADGVEALLGAYFLSGGLEGAWALMAALKILPLPQVPENLCNATKGPERHLGYTFHNRDLLLEAFTHCSWPDPDPQCYQRLEFLGDAVLDMLVTQSIISSYRHLPPGRITAMRAASVNNGRLACIAVMHKLHCYLRQCASPLFNAISDFVESFSNVIEAQQQKHWQSPRSSPASSTSSQAAAQDVDARSSAFQWATSATYGRSDEAAPKVLGDLVESVTGAIFIDCNYDLQHAWKVVAPLLHPMVTPEAVPIHPVTELQERCDQWGLKVAYSSSSGASGESFSMVVTVDTIIVGRCNNAANKQAAKRAAAADALEHWEERIATS